MAPLFLRNLRNHIAFPSFENLPDDSAPSPVYHTMVQINSRTGAFFPHVQWDLIAEIKDITDITRLRLSVKDAGEPQHNFYIHVHTDDHGKSLVSRCHKGHTVVIPHAERHRFLDGTVGVRLEQEDPVAVLPVRMKKLLSANDRFFAGESKDMCGGCRTAVASRFDMFGKEDAVQIRKNCRSNDCNVLRQVISSGTVIARHKVRFPRRVGGKARYLTLISAGTLGYYFWSRNPREPAGVL
ncbi:hypothetical protein FIBSPDRAFT_871255 [Athelia psychrophila]|uniref:Uncharacterized protein n=1 Tax=Athelia psychrophila TaxID=1759441 RepID=A0A166AFH9_9AGAM|nr:hypothetical protein FIBSPDRAFT_871255 [Fibularhizoctonia sp. CBS 109695]